jgi:uncharacterized cupredoxin-like copper-binding protein
MIFAVETGPPPGHGARMHDTRTARAVAAALALLAGGSMAVAAQVADDEQQNLKLPPAVTGADWSRVRELVIELSDHHFEPSELVLKVNVPYMLRLKNIGGIAHDMVGGTFFSKEVIALRMVSSRVGRVTAEVISSIYVRPKNEAELWIVPIKKGEFSFVCSIPGHQEEGMEGTVRIVD